MKTCAFLGCVQIWLLVPHRLGGEFMWAGSCWIGAWQIMFLWTWLSTRFLSTWEAGTGPSMCQQPGTRKTSTSNCGWIWMASQYHQEKRSTTSITTRGITEVPTWNCCSGAGSWLSRLWDIAWLTSCASTPAKPGRSLFEEARRRRKIGLSQCLAGQVAIKKHQL